MQIKTSEQAPTHQFDFDINKISLADLKALYTHFQIEDFHDAEEATDKESFFKCFIEDDINGNSEAYLLIRLAALLSSGAAKIIKEEYIRPDSSTVFRYVLGFRTDYEVDFCESDYFDLTEMGEQISVVIEMYGVEAMTTLLSKYNFLKPQIFFHG